MNAAGSVVLDAAISALVASRQQRRYDDDENEGYYYFSDTSSGRRRRGRRRPRARATVRTAASAAESSIVAFCQTLLSLIKRVVYVSFVSTAILTLSVATYGVIYNLSMPRLAIRSPIYFDYNFVPQRHLSGAYGRYIKNQKVQFCNIETDDNEVGGQEGARQCAHPTTKDARPAPPTAVVDLSMQHTQWHAYHEQVLPAKYEDTSGVHVIKPKRRHFVDLALTLPESGLNRQLGMMMVEVDLIASDGTLLASSGRPTMLPHESAIIGVARKIVLMGPILIGAVAEARTVVLELFDSFVESPELPLAAVVVRLVVPPHTVNGEGHRYAPIQVHSGEVRVGKELNTIQGIMKVWFYSVGLAAVSFLSFFYAFWFLIIRAWFRRQMRHYNSTNRRRAGGEQSDQGDFDFEYDADNDNESADWDSTDGGNDNDSNEEHRGDDQTMESGVNFEELNESDDENWDSIHETSQNSAQGSNEEETGRGDQSNGGVDEQAAKGKGNNEGTLDDDLESLAKELVNDLSFDISEVDSKSGTEGKGPAVTTANGAGGSGTNGQASYVKTPSPSKKKKSSRKVMGSRNGEMKSTTTKSNGNLRKEAEEKLLAEKVMRGDFGPSFEVFTDLDEPDPIV